MTVPVFKVAQSPYSLFAAVLFAFCAGCNGPATNPNPTTEQAPPAPLQEQSAAIEGPHFQISAATPVTGGTVTENWCLGRFGEPVVVNAEKENTNRRYFYLAPGATKVAIGPSGMTALFILRPAGNGVVEIFNGAHFPECLSMPANFFPAQGAATVVRYQNHKKLGFSLEVREENGHPLVTVELPAGNRYAMEVNRCTNCQ